MNVKHCFLSLFKSMSRLKGKNNEQKKVRCNKRDPHWDDARACNYASTYAYPPICHSSLWRNFGNLLIQSRIIDSEASTASLSFFAKPSRLLQLHHFSAEGGEKFFLKYFLRLIFQLYLTPTPPRHLFLSLYDSF